MQYVGTEQQLRVIESYLERRRCALHLPGLACAVLVQGEVALLCGFGYATSGHPITPYTPFVIGSLSKSFTALAVVQLVEAGRVDLDAPVQQYISWFTLHDTALSSRITPRHLLTHTSGISRYAGRVLLSQPYGKTLEQSVRALSHLPLASFPGSHFAYSNTNYMIAGLLLEVVSGMSYASYIKQHIFNPLGMNHSFCTEQDSGADRLHGYRWWFGIPVPFHAPYLEDALPAAYIVSCAEDMGRYMQACLDAGRSKHGVLSAAGFEMVYSPAVALSEKGSYYGLGWRRQALYGAMILRHGGEVSNFRAEMVMAPDKHLAVVVLVNANNGVVAQLGLDQIGLHAMRLLLGLPIPRAHLTFRRFYTLLTALLAALSLVQVWSIVRVIRSLQRPVYLADGLARLAEVAGVSVLVWRLPRWVDMPWNGLLLYVPDVSRWLVFMVSVSWLKGIFRLVQWYFAFYHKERK